MELASAPAGEAELAAESTDGAAAEVEDMAAAAAAAAEEAAAAAASGSRLAATAKLCTCPMSVLRVLSRCVRAVLSRSVSRRALVFSSRSDSFSPNSASRISSICTFSFSACCSRTASVLSLARSRIVIRFPVRTTTPCTTCERPCSTLLSSSRARMSRSTCSSFLSTAVRFSMPARCASSTSEPSAVASLSRTSTCANSDSTPRCTTTAISLSGSSARVEPRFSASRTFSFCA
mmetsp:Transcript_19031/g.56398  ORF Transcript_19031/g.56398 Transcript_19031/m.56398 type:complete len:234 (-) Transcript_19031:1918-2619(-)